MVLKEEGLHVEQLSQQTTYASMQEKQCVDDLALETLPSKLFAALWRTCSRRIEQGNMAGSMPYGFSSMLKEGHKHLEQPVIKNIEACKQLSELTRTSMGPQGMRASQTNH